MLSGLNLPTSNRCSLSLGPNAAIPTVQLISSANLATSGTVRPYLLQQERVNAVQSREKPPSRLLHDAPPTHTVAKSCLEKTDERRVNTQTVTSHSRQNPLPQQFRPANNMNNSLTILTPSTPDYPNSRIGNGDSNDGRQLFYLVPASAAVNSGSSILQGVSNNR